MGQKDGSEGWVRIVDNGGKFVELQEKEQLTSCRY